MAMATKLRARGNRRTSPTSESRLVQWLLIGLAFLFMAVILLLPLYAVFHEAFINGIGEFLGSLAEKDAQAAIRLTLLVAAIAVPLNVIFGLAASWAIAKFEFKGKAFLITLIDLPFSVSPVISGMVYVLLFGAGSVLGPFLKSYGIEVLFALPGIVLATIFVTFPFVAR
ncbi:MAG TPA: sulfate/thiosulfate ABC transporter permease CysW, partial [Devosia sp.]|nr:sulfate/thiosulfate ABC transporter permease CysW [Devosia sp.]